MMTKILIDEAVVRQALEALEYWRTSPETCGFTYKARDALTALRQALEQPAQRIWVGLTDEEVQATVYDANGGVLTYRDRVRAIEAKLKEKNT